MTRGLPASGKSTWAKQYVEYHDKPWYRWNNDDFCYMLTGKMFGRVDGKFLTQRRRGFILGAVRTGVNVILDNTNLNPYTTREVELVLDELGLDIEIEEIFFPIALDEAIQRDAMREHSVGEEVIKSMYDKWIDKWPQLKVD